MLLSYLRNNWQHLTGNRCPEDLQVATVTSCRLDHGNDIVLIFVNRDKLPSYVMKVCRNDRFTFKLNHEFDALRWFAADRGTRVPTPHAHYFGSVGTRTFVVQEAIAGVSLARLLGESGLTRTCRRLLEDAVDILARINRHPAETECQSGLSLDSRIDLDDDARARVETHDQQLSELQERHYVHGDYWPLNLLTRNNRIVGVIDWEFSIGAAAVPTDIVWFLVNVAYLLSMREEPATSIEQAFRRVFFHTGTHNQVIRDLYERYRLAIGLESDLFLPLLAATLGRMGQRELTNYGGPGKMDKTCLELLRYTLANENSLCVA